MERCQIKGTRTQRGDISFGFQQDKTVYDLFQNEEYKIPST
jgi:hypothetical protein